MGNAGTALGIIGIIIAAGAIGFAFFVWNGQNTTNSDVDDLTNELNNLTDEFNDLESDFSNLTRTIVVGIWDNIEQNLDYNPYDTGQDWLCEFGDNKFNDTDYISVSNTNTRITLLKSGWYRIHISMMLSNIGVNTAYYIWLLKDGVEENVLHYYYTSQYAASNYDLHSSSFVESDGTNYIELNGWTSGGTFRPIDAAIYHRVLIEYVVL